MILCITTFVFILLISIHLKKDIQWRMGNEEIGKVEWRAIEVSHAWKGLEQNVEWKMLSTYVEALGVNGDIVKGKHFLFIHRLWGNKDVQWGALCIGHASIGPKALAYVESVLHLVFFFNPF
jgi:hypothetical protein